MSNLLKKLSEAVEKAEKPAPVPAPAAPVAPPVASQVYTPQYEAAPQLSAAGCRPAPWPIDAATMTAEQISKMTREEEARANAWGDRILAGWSNNGDPLQPIRTRFWNFRARYVKSEDLPAPINGTVWEEIWNEFVKQPLPVPAKSRQGRSFDDVSEAYKARAAKQAPGPTPPEDVEIGQ